MEPNKEHVEFCGDVNANGLEFETDEEIKADVIDTLEILNTKMKEPIAMYAHGNNLYELKYHDTWIAKCSGIDSLYRIIEGMLIMKTIEEDEEHGN